MTHPGRDTLLAFVSGRTDDADAEAVYQHIAECPRCERRVDALRVLRDRFDESWSFFESVLGDVALSFEEKRFRASTNAIVVDFKGLIDAGRRLAIAARNTVADAAAQAAGAFDGRLAPAYGGVGDVPAGDPATPHVERAAELIGAADVDAARAELETAHARDPRSTGVVELDLTWHDEVCGKLVVNAPRRRLSVLVHPRAEFAAGAVRLRGEGYDEHRALEPVEGAAYLLAEFDAVPDGAFDVALVLAPTATA